MPNNKPIDIFSGELVRLDEVEKWILDLKKKEGDNVFIIKGGGKIYKFDLRTRIITTQCTTTHSAKFFAKTSEKKPNNPKNENQSRNILEKNKQEIEEEWLEKVEKNSIIQKKFCEAYSICYLKDDLQVGAFKTQGDNTCF